MMPHEESRTYRVHVLQAVPKHPQLTTTTLATLLHPEQPVATPGQSEPRAKRQSAAVSGTLGVGALRTSKELNVAHPAGDSNPPAKRSRLSRLSRKAT